MPEIPQFPKPNEDYLDSTREIPEHLIKQAEQIIGLAEDDADLLIRSEERMLSTIAGNSTFKFKRGKRWEINQETGDATYDLKFFIDKGYSRSQSVFASFHEIKCHLVETADILSTTEGKKTYEAQKTKNKEAKRYRIWENYRSDIKGNRAILQYAPALQDEVERLYAEKLFPTADLNSTPMHIQFMDAVIREKMIPGSNTQISPQVKEEIDKLKNFNGKDVLDLATDPKQDPVLALKLSLRFILPIIDKLYEEDKQNQKSKNKDSQSGDDNANGRDQADEITGDNKDFDSYYEKREENHPEPIDEEQIEEILKNIKDNKSSDEKRQETAYEKENGVTKKNTEDYFREYKKVEPYVNDLREVFKRIISERIAIKRRLGSLKEEGIMVDPGLLTQTYLDLKAGIDNPKTMKDFEKYMLPIDVPSDFRFRLVADQSGSMMGEKAIMQRKTSVLIMEALKVFSDMTKDNEYNLIEDMNIETELRAFGVKGAHKGIALYKPLTKELNEKQRIEFFRKIALTNGTTNDFDCLEEIIADVKQKGAQDSEYLTKLKSGKLKEVVVVLTDGGSDSEQRVARNLKILRNYGIKVIGLGMTGEGEQAVKTYAPDAQVCLEIKDLPRHMFFLLKDLLDDFSIKDLDRMLQ